jgi:aspartate/methionine/tyrosine aminotransferase
MDRDDYQRLVALAEERGIVLFSDEVYRWLEIDESQRLPAAVELGARAVSLGVMSKSFALAGLRIGWIATHGTALLQKVAALKDYTTICSSAPSEVLALIALRARDKVLDRSRGILARNLPLLDAFFARRAEHFSWVRPRAGSVGFPRMQSGDDAALEHFTSALVETEGVLLLPGSQFGYSGTHFRLGFGRHDMPVALDRLEAFVCKTLG